MRFYKSLWFWLPLIIFFIIGIGLDYLLSLGVGEKTPGSPPGFIAGLIVGLVLGFFLWMIFGKIEKIKIPENIENGFEIPITLAYTTEAYSPKIATKIADKMNSLTGADQKAWVSSSINPELILYPDKFKYKVVLSEKERKYSDIEMLDVLTGWVSENSTTNTKSKMSLKFGHAMNINLKLKDKNELSFNLHRKSNLIELLKFLKSKNVPLSENAENLMQEN